MRFLVRSMKADVTSVKVIPSKVNERLFRRVDPRDTQVCLGVVEDERFRGATSKVADGYSRLTLFPAK
jgi:hypothetical protein